MANAGRAKLAEKFDSRALLVQLATYHIAGRGRARTERLPPNQAAVRNSPRWRLLDFPARFLDNPTPDLGEVFPRGNFSPAFRGLTGDFKKRFDEPSHCVETPSRATIQQ